MSTNLLAMTPELSRELRGLDIRQAKHAPASKTPQIIETFI